MLLEARSPPCFQIVFDVRTFELTIGSVRVDLEYFKYSRSSLTEPIVNSKVRTLKTKWKHRGLRDRGGAAHRQEPRHLQERRRRHDPHPLPLRQPPLLHPRPLPPSPSSSSSSSAAAAAPAAAAAAAAAAAVEVILRWDASPDALVWDASPEAAAEYLAAVDAATAAEGGGGADAVVQLAMARLEDEFQHLMVRSTVPLDANGLSCSIRRLSLSFGSDGGESPVADDLDSSAEFDQQHPPLPRSGSVGESANFDDQNAELVRPRPSPI
uniref:Uncharacterized protein n=1 Tax=Ananas comosus var. bracteatus TaxID=296719 RepID=A0A6V7Q0B3_ANACO|nr:unnamed protein product [Ananas comosus var. bracteatus]